MPRAAGNDLQSDLNSLAQSKALLASAIDIVRYLERIQRSLETVAVLGADANKIPVEAKRFFLNLGKRITQLPAPQLRAYLGKLDALISTDLDRIVSIADGAVTPELLDDANALFGLDESAVKNLINEFERRTRTSVSMRVLMIRRGLQVDVLVIPIAEEVLQGRIEQLDEKEKECTGHIQEEIVAMKQDVELILEHHPCSDTLKKQLEAVRDELQLNLEHIRAGNSIDELPFPIEVAEGTDTNVWQTPSEPEPGPEPEPETGQEPPPAEPGEFDAAPSGSAPAADAPETRSRGFFGTLWVYVTTPNHVNWEQARIWRRKD